MKAEKRQTIMEGEIKVLKDTVWRLTTRVYGLEEQIKEMKTRLKITTAVDSRLVYSQQILTNNPSPGGRSSRTSTKAAIPVTPSCSKSSPRVKEKAQKPLKTVKFENISPTKKRSQTAPVPKIKMRQIAVKKTGNSSTSATGKAHRRLQHQSVITQRGRRATSFKLQPSDEEKEVYFVSDSSADESESKSKTKTKTLEKQKITSPNQKTPPDSAADDFMKVLNETPSGDYSTLAHEDLIVFPTPEINVVNDGSAIGQEDSDQLPIKKRKVDCAGTSTDDDLFRQTPEERVTEDELAESVMEGVVSYIHRPPDSFNCFFCGQQFPTDEERVVHSKIHAGAPKKS